MVSVEGCKHKALAANFFFESFFGLSILSGETRHLTPSFRHVNCWKKTLKIISIIVDLLTDRLAFYWNLNPFNKSLQSRVRLSWINICRRSLSSLDFSFIVQWYRNLIISIVLVEID